MSQIHDRVMVALAHAPGKRQTVTEVTRYVNKHFKYTDAQILDALEDLQSERSVVQHTDETWVVLDGRKKGSASRMSRSHQRQHQQIVKRVNRAS